MNMLEEFAKRFTKLDPAFGYVAVAFLIACMLWAFSVLFLRDDVLGKIVMVSAIIVMTMYHPIAGIIALIIIIAMLNQKPNKKSMLNSIPTPPPHQPVQIHLSAHPHHPPQFLSKPLLNLGKSIAQRKREFRMT